MYTSHNFHYKIKINMQPKINYSLNFLYYYYYLFFCRLIGANAFIEVNHNTRRMKNINF